jgi:hypothetical protein
MNLSEMTKDERSLLLYLETCAVDYGGKVESKHMNNDDFEIAKRWNESGFVKFGRIKFKSIIAGKDHWCELSDEAWSIAHQERKARYNRIIKAMPIDRTCDK